MFTFEPTINLGNVITITLALAAALGAWYKVGSRLDLIEYRVKAIEDTLKTLSEVLKSIANTDKEIAVLDQRQLAVEGVVSTLSRDVADLRRGEGFIQAPRRGNVDGEYTR